MEGRTLEELFAGRDYDIDASFRRMKALMDAEGLPYEKRTHTYNSRLAQEIGKWADTLPGGGDAVHDGFYRAYFVDRRNIAEEDVILDVVGAAGLPVEDARQVLAKRSFKDAVDADWVRARLGDSGLVLLDTRTREEYDGTGGRRGLPSLGHLAGARLLLWQDLVVQEGSPYLRAPDQLRRIYRAAGVAPGNRVVTYCYVGYRASLTYFVARVLGHEARFYDGSYDDWARRRYPVTKGPTP